MPNNIAHAVYLTKIQILIDRFPRVFNKSDPLPLKIGVFEELITLPNLGMCDDELEYVLSCWTCRREYCRSMVEKGWRYTLDGERHEPIAYIVTARQEARLARFIRKGML